MAQNCLCDFRVGTKFNEVRSQPSSQSVPSMPRNPCRFQGRADYSCVEIVHPQWLACGWRIVISPKQQPSFGRLERRGNRPFEALGQCAHIRNNGTENREATVYLVWSKKLVPVAPEQELIAQRPLKIKPAREVFARGHSRHVSRLLLHPLLIWVRRESCQIHPASRQVDEEQHIVGRQPFERLGLPS